MKSSNLALIFGILGLLLSARCWLSGAGNQYQASAPAAVTRLPATVSGAAAHISLTTREDGKIAIEGALPQESAKTRVLKAAGDVYGAGMVVDKIGVNKELAALSSVTLTGNVTSNGAKELTAERARSIFGAVVPIDNQLVVHEASAATASAPAATASAPATAAQQQLKLREALLGKTVEFELSSASLTAAGRAVLDEIVPIMQEDKSTHIEVQGHTDTKGDPSFNTALSLARAGAARDYLVAHGVSAERLSAHGYGSEKPLTDNATLAGRRQNRRIEFLVQERN